MFSKRQTTITVISIALIACTILIQQCKPKEDNSTIATISANDYVGLEKCASCHTNEYKAWLSSDHFKAMQAANDSSVEGNFNNVSFTADAVTSRFFKKNGKYFINTQGDDGANHDYEIKYTFGYYPLQQYLVAFPGGRLQATRASWDVKNKKWYNQYTGEKIAAHDWLHWTGNAQNWNTMCAACHSTNLQKNYNPTTDTYNTTYSVINVSCESCHGAGKLHIDYINSSDYKNGKKTNGSFIQLFSKTGQQAEINTCAPCHARIETIHANAVDTSEILNDYIPEIPTTEHYYADGQANDEDYIYTSFLESKMYRRGVSCSNCHNPHTGKILFTTNTLCLQCHGKNYDDPAHTFHAANTEASACKSCHMPGKTYMGIDYRYDHTFRVPRPDLSAQYGTPNACNNCHKDKSFTWAANAITKWYGPTRKYHFADDLIPGSKLDSNSYNHLAKLITDTAIPTIVKSAATYYLGQLRDSKSLNALITCLQNAAADVRYRAVRGLANYPPDSWLSAAAPLLSDSVTAVRIAAADLFITVPQNQLPDAYSNAFQKAKEELLSFNLSQADFSVGDMMLGDYYLKTQDYSNAEKYYLLSLKKDTSLNYSRLNLSVVYNLTKRNEQSLNILLEAARIDPKNDRTFFNLALLYNEMNNKNEAAKYLQKAVDLKSKNPSVYYNYGILLQQLDKKEMAEKILQQGIAISPLDEELNYALAVFYLQNGKKDKARTPALVLKNYYSSNPQYQGIFQSLGL